MEQIILEKDFINNCYNFFQKNYYTETQGMNGFFNKKEGFYIFTDGYKLAKIDASFFENKNIEKIKSGIIPIDFFNKYKNDFSFYLEGNKKSDQVINCFLKTDSVEENNKIDIKPINQTNFVKYQDVESEADSLKKQLTLKNIEKVYNGLKNGLKILKDQNKIAKLKHNNEAILNPERLYIKLEIKNNILFLSLRHEDNETIYFEYIQDIETAADLKNYFCYYTFFKTIELFYKIKKADCLDFFYNPEKAAKAIKLETEGIKVIIMPKREPESEKTR